MNQFIKGTFLLVAFALLCVSSVSAATPKKGYDKYGKPLPGTTSPLQDLTEAKNKTIQPVQVEAPVVTEALPDPVAVELPEQVVPHRGQSGHYECDFPYGCKATGPGFAGFTCQLNSGVWRDCQVVQQFCYDESRREEPFEPQLYRQHCFA